MYDAPFKPLQPIDLTHSIVNDPLDRYQYPESGHGVVMCLGPAVREQLRNGRMLDQAQGWGIASEHQLDLAEAFPRRPWRAMTSHGTEPLVENTTRT